MIDLHSHLLPGVDDGAADLSVSIEMARLFVEDGVSVVACTPHILPGLYHNDGPAIRVAIDALQHELDRCGIQLKLVPGADAHMCPDFVDALKSGRILTLAGSRYVLVEPPHHTAPQRLEEFFFSILVAGYVPILTHPERLHWINDHYHIVKRLASAGIWNQITAGSLTGAFGKNARYWGERMLGEGLVHLLASDAHDTIRRPPLMSRGRDVAALRVGEEEALNLVLVRPRGVLNNEAPSNLPPPPCLEPTTSRDRDGPCVSGADRSWSGRLRRFFN